MISKIQLREIYERVNQTVLLFLENDGCITDEKLAEILALKGISTSSSTVGRDLVSQYAKCLFPNEFEKIKKLRNNNKYLGKIKGGINSTNRNIIIKDEQGRFQGCKAR